MGLEGYVNSFPPILLVVADMPFFKLMEGYFVNKIKFVVSIHARNQTHPIAQEFPLLFAC